MSVLVAIGTTPRLVKVVLTAVGSIVVLPAVLLGAAGGALVDGTVEPSGGAIVAAWGSDIPPEMAALYEAAATRFAVPAPVLQAVGKVETDHCRNRASLTPNNAGAVGCMQFLPATFERWAWASGSAEPSITDPTDAVYAAAAKLSADGIASNPWQALWAYNHSDRYVAEVLSWAVAYGWRTDARAVLGRAVLAHPRIAVRVGAVTDLEEQLVDARVLSALLALGTRHHLAAVGPFTRHSYYVRGTDRPSNHVFGRAVDVAAVGGAPVAGHNDAARALVTDLLSLPEDIRPHEVLSPWDVRIGDAWSVTDDDHHDHVHLGYDDGAGR